MAAAGSSGGGGSFKERTFADFNIDPLSLDAEGNDKVLDLIEENNTLTHEVRDLRSQLAQQAADSREAAAGPSPEAVAEMQAELARLMAENADLKTGVKPGPPSGGGSRPGTPPLTGLGRKGSGQLAGRALARQASDGSTADYTAKLEDQVDLLMEEVSGLLSKVNQLEDDLDAARTSGVSSAAAPAPAAPAQASDGDDGEVAALREENATLQRRLTALQVQVESGRTLGKIPSDKEVAESEALVAEIMSLQAQVEGGAPPPDAARDAAEKTLAALTEQNQRLAAEKAAADAAAKDAAAERAAAQEALDALTEQYARQSDELGELKAAAAAAQAPRTPSKIDMKLLAAVERHKAEAAELGERNAALSGSVRALQSQLAKAEAAALAAAGMTAQLDAAKSELSQLRDTKMLRADADAITEAKAKQLQAEAEAADAKKRAAEALAGRADAQRALDNVAKRIPELEGEVEALRDANRKLEAEVADLTRSSATGAATLGEQLAEQQDRWAKERRELARELAEAKEAASSLAEENQALVAKVQRLVPPPDRASDGSRDGSPTKSLAGGEGNIALMRDLAEENDKLAAENARLTKNAKTLLEQNSELMNQLIDVSLGGGEDDGFAAAASAEDTGTRRDSFISKTQLLEQQRGQQNQQQPTPTSTGRAAAADGTPGSSMSLPASPEDAAPQSPAVAVAAAAAQQRGQRPERKQEAATASQQRGQEAAPGGGGRVSAMAALAALYAKEEAAAAAADAGSSRQDDSPRSQQQLQQQEAEEDISLPLSPTARGGVDMLRRRHAEIAEQVERSQQVAEEDAGRRATLQSRTRQHLDAYEKVKAEALQRLQSIASSGGGTPPNRPPRSERADSAQGVPRAASFSRTGSVRINSLASSAGDSPRQQEAAAAATAAAATYGSFTPPLSGHRRRISGASDATAGDSHNVSPAVTQQQRDHQGDHQRDAQVPDSPASSAAGSSRAGSAAGDRGLSSSAAGPGGLLELRGFGGGGFGGGIGGGSSVGRNHSDASEGSAGGSFSANSLSTPARRRSSVSEASQVDRAEATRRLQEEAAAQRPEGLEGVRTADRRARQEVEEAARLKQKADSLVRSAYYRYSGNEDVGAFMRALGYDFKSDPGADVDGLLFKRALRLTHPDKNTGADAWGRAVAAAAFPKLQEWQAEAALL